MGGAEHPYPKPDQVHPTATPPPHPQVPPAPPGT